MGYRTRSPYDLERASRAKPGWNRERGATIGHPVGNSHFRIMVGEIERARTEPQQSKLDTAAFNQRLADQVEVLEKVRIEVKKAGV